MVKLLKGWFLIMRFMLIEMVGLSVSKVIVKGMNGIWYSWL